MSNDDNSREKMAYCMPPYPGCSFGDEDIIPEPAYFKLKHLQSEYIPSSDPDQDGYSDEDSSIDGDDIELDLFAPPHDS